MPGWVESQRNVWAKRAGNRNRVPGARPVRDSRIFGCLMPGMAVARSGRVETREGDGAFHVGLGAAGSGTSTLAREMRA